MYKHNAVNSYGYSMSDAFNAPEYSACKNENNKVIDAVLAASILLFILLSVITDGIIISILITSVIIITVIIQTVNREQKSANV